MNAQTEKLIDKSDNNGGVVIVGAGQAGAGTALALRRLGYEGPIRLLGREAHPPYERPQLTKAYLSGESPFEKLVVLDAARAAELDIALNTGVEVTAIVRDTKSVTISTGERIPYETLVLATGGEARVAPGLEPDGERVFSIRTREDSERIGRAIDRCSSLLVIGGGWLGLEIAATARQKGLAVTLVEAGQRLCGRAAPEALSRDLTQLHQGQGVEIRLGTSVSALDRAATGVSVRLGDGETIAADICVVAIGLVPNDAVALSAGLEAGNGIATDAAGRTADPSIYAVGDCTRYLHPFYGETTRLESWQNANVQSELAAHAILGLDCKLAEIPWFWSDQYRTNVQILGITPADTPRIVRRGGDDIKTVLFVDGESRLRGAYALNNPREIAMARRLITQNAIIDVEKAADPETLLSKVSVA